MMIDWIFFPINIPADLPYLNSPTYAYIHILGTYVWDGWMSEWMNGTRAPIQVHYNPSNTLYWWYDGQWNSSAPRCCLGASIQQTLL